MSDSSRGTPPARTWIITGPTSGIGRRTALKLAEHGSVVLVGSAQAGVLGEWQPGGSSKAGFDAYASSK